MSGNHTKAAKRKDGETAEVLKHLQFYRTAHIICIEINQRKSLLIVSSSTPRPWLPYGLLTKYTLTP